MTAVRQGILSLSPIWENGNRTDGRPQRNASPHFFFTSQTLNQSKSLANVARVCVNINTLKGTGHSKKKTFTHPQTKEMHRGLKLTTKLIQPI